MYSEMDDEIITDAIDTSQTIKQEQLDINDAIELLAKNQERILTRLEEISKRQDEMSKMICENNALLKEGIIANRNQKVTTRFPLKTEQDLQEIDKVLQGDEWSDIVFMLKNILAIGGIQGNINKLFSTDLILQYNVDGFKGKNSLKTYQALMDALFEATTAEGRTQKDFYNDIRAAFKVAKNRFHKQKWRLKQMDDPLAVNEKNAN